MKNLLILGCGYVGEKLARACLAKGVNVFATTRSQERVQELEAAGVQAMITESPDQLPDELLCSIDAVVDSIPMVRSEGKIWAGQPEWVPQLAAKLKQVKWVGHLSSTGVYGDAGGAWVDEQWPCQPGSERGKQRLLAESTWLNSGLPVEVFRLAGIYGPDRNIVPRVKKGGYRVVRWEPPHYSSRIHVDDIVDALLAAMEKPRAGRIMNLADDEPLPHIDYVIAMARLLDAREPVVLTEEEGRAQLSAAALDFYQDNKRVSNRLLHEELLPELKYPSFREGFASLEY